MPLLCAHSVKVAETIFEPLSRRIAFGTAHPSDDGVQSIHIGSRYLGWRRDSPDDAKTPRPFYLQFSHYAEKTIRGDRRPC